MEKTKERERKKWNIVSSSKDLTITQATVQTKHFIRSYLSFTLFAHIQNNIVDNHNKNYNNYRFLTQQQQQQQTKTQNKKKKTKSNKYRK